MVNSILNSEINYPEIKKLDSDDTDYDASLYETTILGVDVIIALGQAKYIIPLLIKILYTFLFI